VGRRSYAKSSDRVLSRMQKPLYERLVAMWKRSNCGLSIYGWLAQRIETDVVIPAFRAEQAPGVDAKPKPVPPRKNNGSGNHQLSPEQIEEVKAAVVSGRIRPDSPIALLAASEEGT
jgi:hypothetical protein